MSKLNNSNYLETIINYTIETYNNERKALIFKNSPKLLIRNNRYYSLNQGTVDYHGVYQGKYLCFEAKMTNKLNLPWKNIKEHQWNFLQLAHQQQAISFIIIYFSFYQQYYLVFINQLIILRQKKLKISFQWIKKNGSKLELINPFLLDFLKII
ncbi:MAG: Holliday junction resolvase RecU [Spiroplasma sp.]|nr:Holliday junction resolvase RecU [Spiroplasma sp.]